MRISILSTFGLTAALAIASQAAPGKLALNTLIVAGGPKPVFNQYAIESNARYVEKLTEEAAIRRILFADGSKTSETISTFEQLPDEDEQSVFNWLFKLHPYSPKVVYNASSLNQIDGPSTLESVQQNIGWLTEQADNGQKSLLYYTGHGTPGIIRQAPAPGQQQGRMMQDTLNTNFNLWNEQNISVKQTAAALKNWPAKTPLIAVMVQCYAGGYANLMFEDGDPTKPLLDRDFAGFFATVGERMASGCTSQVNEKDYQDFTTHFFAALSGESRDGRKVTGADYDRNGKVSMLEALAWTNLNDRSIDVPVCTSDTYLRTVFPQADPPTWTQTSYASVLKTAAPWQKATLEGLSKELGLTGDVRIDAAMKLHDEAVNAQKSGGRMGAPIDDKATQALYDELVKDLEARFPDLKKPANQNGNKEGRVEAVKYLAENRKADVKRLVAFMNKLSKSGDDVSVTEAMSWRFVRASRTVLLEQRLMKDGTEAQKAAFKRLRASESVNPLI